MPRLTQSGQDEYRCAKCGHDECRTERVLLTRDDLFRHLVPTIPTLPVSLVVCVRCGYAELYAGPGRAGGD